MLSQVLVYICIKLQTTECPFAYDTALLAGAHADTKRAMLRYTELGVVAWMPKRFSLKMALVRWQHQSTAPHVGKSENIRYKKSTHKDCWSVRQTLTDANQPQTQYTV